MFIDGVMSRLTLICIYTLISTGGRCLFLSVRRVTDLAPLAHATKEKE